MLDIKTFDDFIRKANRAYQQFCVWVYTNNEFAKHQTGWNKILTPFKTEEFSQDIGCKYKNFWSVVIPSLQHGWIMSVARLFDLAYHSRDKKKEKPRLSLEYILELLDDASFAQTIRNKVQKHHLTIQSLKTQRNNFIAHNSVNFESTKIEAGIENLFEELDNIISDIKYYKPHIGNCNNINLKYTEVLSHCGVDEIFEALLKK